MNICLHFLYFADWTYRYISWKMTKLAHNYFCMFTSILYMFRETSCSASGESIVSIHLVYVTLKISEESKITRGVSRRGRFRDVHDLAVSFGSFLIISCKIHGIVFRNIPELIRCYWVRFTSDDVTRILT
jgi:hypothetical protein